LTRLDDRLDQVPIEALLAAVLRRSGPATAALNPPPPAETVDALKRRLMRQALAEANGNKREAARALGVGRSTLYRYLDKKEECSGQRRDGRLPLGRDPQCSQTT
jgi:DNA-binding NtrC family response regulator